MTPPPPRGLPVLLDDSPASRELLADFLGAVGFPETVRAFSRFLAHLTGRPAAFSVLDAEGRPSSGVFGVRPTDEEGHSERLCTASEAALLEVEDSSPGVTAGLLCLPIPRAGSVAAAVAFEPGEDARAGDRAALAQLLLPLISWKAGKDHALLTADARARHHDRWFKTVDAQLRVLDRERQKFLAMVNRGDASVMVLGPDAAVRWVNPEMNRTHGDPEDSRSLVGKRCQDFCGHGPGACPDCPVQRVLRGDSIAHQERRHESGGAVRELYVTALPIRSPEGAVDEVLVTLQDLTDLEVLRRSEARHRQLFERSADAILMVEPGTLRIVLANGTAQAILGYPEEELIGRSLRDLHPREELHRIEPHYEAMGEGRHAGGVDAEVFTAAGERLICNVCGALFDLDGSQVLMIELRDVTTVRRLERELAHADRLASLGTMSAGIAHEFKNRLSPIRGLTQLLAGQGGCPERTGEYCVMLLREVDRLTTLVREVLDFARPQAARPAPHDLAAVARTVTEEFRREYAASLSDNRIEVRLEVPAGLALPVSLDGEQIRRVFQNIFKNALEACPPDRAIEVRVRRAGSWAFVTVADNGCGIEPAALRRVFDPFFSTKGSGGTGLGMPIVKSLIESNGGTIDMRSREGEGTEVELGFEMVGRGEALGKVA